MYLPKLFIASILISCCLSQTPSDLNSTMKILVDRFERLAAMHETENRTEELKNGLLHTAGVYADKDKAKKYGVQNTVLVGIWSTSDSNNNRYIQLLRNWFCWASLHGLSPLIYVLRAEGDENFDGLNFVGENVVHVSYPLHSFWKFLTLKGRPIQQRGSHRMDYEGNVPTYAHFGALVTLVPLLEILEMGYNVIYLDVDVVMVQDPIPLMVAGNADFTVSQESRTCIYSSELAFGLKADWEGLEPNTGILHVRSNPDSVDVFRQWMQRLIDENFSNDQFVLKYANLGARLSFSCNKNLASLDTDPEFQKLRPNINSNVSLCFLNELRFQNGKIALGCSVGRGGSPSEYVMAMNEMGLVDERARVEWNRTIVTPALVHVNYCDDKIAEIARLGLWLVPHKDRHSDKHQGNALGHGESDLSSEAPYFNASHSSASSQRQCRKFDLRKSTFGLSPWEDRVEHAKKELDDARHKFSNNSIVKLHRDPRTYLVVNGTLRAFPDMETFNKMGYDYRKLHWMKTYNFIKQLLVGEELPTLDGLKLAQTETFLHMALRHFPNNTVFKLLRGRSLYVKINNCVKEIPDWETFTLMGYDAKTIQQMKHASFDKRTHLCGDLPSLVTTASPSTPPTLSPAPNSAMTTLAFASALANVLSPGLSPNLRTGFTPALHHALQAAAPNTLPTSSPRQS